MTRLDIGPFRRVGTAYATVGGRYWVKRSPEGSRKWALVRRTPYGYERLGEFRTLIDATRYYRDEISGN